MLSMSSSLYNVSVIARSTICSCSGISQPSYPYTPNASLNAWKPIRSPLVTVIDQSLPSSTSS
jgi:hypothetical protein